ncbi:MAG: protein kinase [Acidobacteria bacterium]|nr:protein kinase [Acidobacteriota bacterium]
MASSGVDPMPPKYTILQELGAGGMGKVYKGLLVGQAGFQRPLVIKQVKYADEPGHVKLFVEEARRYAVLDHENIGRIFDFEEVDGRLCIILEYIDGWSLVEYVERHRELERFPDVELSVFIASRVCRALQYVYERSAIVHRDISPSNIMMTREGTVKLIDFGIATRSGTRDSSLTGKPAYMAPEMIVELRADNRSDLFSLGAVLFEMLTKERLFQGKATADILEQVVAGHPPSPRAFNPDIPDGVMEILRKALQRDPAKRYANAGEMGQACEHYLYDKGYGPTNLTLKQYVYGLFPEAAVEPASPEAPAYFPVIEPTLIPIGEALPVDRSQLAGEQTPATPLSRPYVPSRRPPGSEPLTASTLPPETLAPDPPRHPPRPRKVRRPRGR